MGVVRPAWPCGGTGARRYSPGWYPHNGPGGGGAGGQGVVCAFGRGRQRLLARLPARLPARAAGGWWWPGCSTPWRTGWVAAAAAATVEATAAAAADATTAALSAAQVGAVRAWCMGCLGLFEGSVIGTRWGRGGPGRG